jgi:hypothetical protein
MPTRALICHPPSNADPERTRVLVGLYGRGLALDLREFTYHRAHTFDVSAAREARVLYWHPLHRVVTLRFTPEAWPEEPLAPALEPLPTTPLRGQLVSRAGAPVAGARVEVTRLLGEAMDSFGYADGMVPQATLANGVTDADGAFTLELPVLAADPFLRRERELLELVVHRDPQADPREGESHRLRALVAYPEPLRIVTPRRRREGRELLP